MLPFFMVSYHSNRKVTDTLAGDKFLPFQSFFERVGGHRRGIRVRKGEGKRDTITF